MSMREDRSTLATRETPGRITRTGVYAIDEEQGEKMGRRRERQASQERVEDLYEKNKSALLEYAKTIDPKMNAIDLIAEKNFVARLKRRNRPKGMPFLDWAKHILCQCDEVISWHFEENRSDLLDYANSLAPTIAVELTEELAIQLELIPDPLSQTKQRFWDWAKQLFGRCEKLIAYLLDQHKEELKRDTRIISILGIPNNCETNSSNI